ncbi:IclR family transcriptional regulator [Kamptonema cortianum]|jgi:DNA-binding IclR family transcriptional regulator|nr:IclR family transcriptional regulator [Oscillatoria laete-virens]MDK3158206.1 IclR family transcriptional regulator [Kamptonema cortianum]MDL5055452.1 IclR family transcriptional regulator [Oscillatoria laete-virens NRMC-F 0139]
MIASVAKALDILQLFSIEQPTLTLSEISRRMGIPKSTAHHLLLTMANYGFIEQTADGAYAIGKEVIALTQAVRVNVELRDRAAPLLRALAETCSESVYLTVRDGDQVLYIYAVESSQRLLARTAVGDRAPLYCTSVGKAVLAFLPPEEVSAIYEGRVLPPFTRNTLTDFPALREDLLRTRARGYSVDNQEHELDTYCIGAPIFDGQGNVIGACSVSGRDPEIIGSRLEALASSVADTAQETSRRMGYVPARMSMVHRVMKR